MGQVIRKSVLRAKRAAISGWAAARPRFNLRVGDRLLKIPATPTTGWVLSWQPDWKTQLIGKLLTERPGLFADVGANIGQTLFDYCAAPSRQGYIGFEPGALCIDHLNRIIDANALTDCTIYPMALADTSRPLSFYTHGATDPGASLVADMEPNRVAKELIVPAYRFDDLGLSPSVVKIDVEGAEAAVLDGMRETLRTQEPLIICEVLNRDETANARAHQERGDRLLTILRDANYSVFRICKAADLKTVDQYQAVDGFPADPFSERNRHECDYLFAPAGYTLSAH
jgi:FkbM family methyltransferase